MPNVIVYSAVINSCKKGRVIIYNLITGTCEKGQSAQIAVHLSQEMLFQHLLTISAHEKGKYLHRALHPSQRMQPRGL